MSQVCPHAYDWDPRDEQTLQDQIAAYDTMRKQCPVAHSEYLHWSVFRHAEAVRILNDHETFSSQVSSHVSVPNGMDPPEHTSFRQLIEPYFGPEAMADFKPACEAIAQNLVGNLGLGPIDIMAQVAHPYALEVQCAFMGWPTTLHQPLRNWIRKNHEATLSKDRAAISRVAQEFDGYMLTLINERRRAGAQAPDDTTTRLTHEQVNGRPLSDPELISILRNWTVGELSTIAASVGILAHYLAARPALQDQLRAKPELLPPAIDEILRIHAPLIANRRIATRPVALGGRHLEAGDRISILWASANRDETVFGDPDEFHPDRDSSLNLLYGAGIHVCPGAPLARMELKLIMESLLACTQRFELASGQVPVRARYPGSGYTSLILQVF
ncbi:cytochrome P450 [Pollutimonas harenae]|uniref:Cytochrome P450 n=1 Tax=Pollutimonas harenae TaxID=657015 RepID=A0A853H8Y2_9BURK|nr:cytochrome P450 [Pollutimonas harenae]NYT86504.1 cytochrome P450 [Pollutimonas harenae]TEA69752.1 cytochrome P450 [Pollutimonas harenae]